MDTSHPDPILPKTLCAFHERRRVSCPGCLSTSEALDNARHPEQNLPEIDGDVWLRETFDAAITRSPVLRGAAKHPASGWNGNVLSIHSTRANRVFTFTVLDGHVTVAWYEIGNRSYSGTIGTFGLAAGHGAEGVNRMAGIVATYCAGYGA